MEQEMQCTMNETNEKTNTAAKTVKRKKKPGFTLIEVIAVMAIIGVMVAALLPSVQTAMNKSKDTEIINNLAMLDSAAKVYELENGEGTLGAEPIDTLKNGNYVPQKNYDGIDYDSKNKAFTATLSDKKTKVSSDKLDKRSTSSSAAAGD